MIKSIALACIAMSVFAWGCVSADALSDDQKTEETTTQQLGSSGPFSSKQAVINFWTNTSTDTATQIFLNGKIIFSRSGFGPPIIDQYFVCVSSNNNIYESCPNAPFAYYNGYSNFNTLVSVCPSGSTINKDGILFRSGTSGDIIGIATCPINGTLVGTIKYYKVTSESFGPPYSSMCY